MKINSGEFAKYAAHPMVEAAQSLMEQAARGPGRELRELAINPMLRSQGEFMAGSGQGLTDILQEWAGTLGGQRGSEMFTRALGGRPISDSAVALGAGGLGGTLLGGLLPE